MRKTTFYKLKSTCRKTLTKVKNLIYSSLCLKLISAKQLSSRYR